MLSPLYPATPVPAIVVMVPLVSIFRTTWLCRSQKYTFPAGSVTIPRGSFNLAPVANPPSPEYPGAPVPAMVVIVKVGTEAANNANVEHRTKAAMFKDRKCFCTGDNLSFGLVYAS